MPVYKATFHSHEGNEIRVLQQEFSGSPGEISLNYFDAYGDYLGKLEDPDGEVLYEDMSGMHAWHREMLRQDGDLLPDLEVVNTAINSAYDQRDYQAMCENLVVADFEGCSVAKHIKNCIDSMLEDVRNPDGSVCPPEDRAGWIHLVY